MLKRVAAAVLAFAITASAWAGPAEDKALIEAAFGLDIEGVQAALAKGADPNSKKSDLTPGGNVYSIPVLLSVNCGGEGLYWKLLRAGFSRHEAAKPRERFSGP
jgi:hypothetical protein